MVFANDDMFDDNLELKANATMGFEEAQEYEVGEAVSQSLIHLLYF